jgi:hypothetical protein
MAREQSQAGSDTTSALSRRRLTLSLTAALHHAYNDDTHQGPVNHFTTV